MTAAPERAPDPLAAPPFPRLARLAASGRLPPSLLLTGPSGAPTEPAAIALAAIRNNPDGDPDSAATRRLIERIRVADAVAHGLAGGKRSAPGPLPFPDVTVVRPGGPMASRSSAKGRRRAPTSSGRQMIRVDRIREAVSECRARPFEGRRRFLIVVGADEMNPQASNALLKTLEEPHARLIVVLCAVRESRLLPTIVSRCQRWRFRAPTPRETAATLERDHDYPRQEAALAATAAGGDPALAAALPRELLAKAGEIAVRLAAVAVRGIAPQERAALTNQLSRRPTASSAARGAPDPLHFVLSLLRPLLRDLAASASGANPVSAHLPPAAVKLAASAPPDVFAEAYRIASETGRNLFESSGNRKMQLEAMLLDFNEIARPLAVRQASRRPRR